MRFVQNLYQCHGIIFNIKNCYEIYVWENHCTISRNATILQEPIRVHADPGIPNQAQSDQISGWSVVRVGLIYINSYPIEKRALWPCIGAITLAFSWARAAWNTSFGLGPGAPRKAQMEKGIHGNWIQFQIIYYSNKILSKYQGSIGLKSNKIELCYNWFTLIDD